METKGLFCPLTRVLLDGADVAFSMEVRLKDKAVTRVGYSAQDQDMNRPASNPQSASIWTAAQSGARGLPRTACNLAAFLCQGVPVPGLMPGWSSMAADLTIVLARDAVVRARLDRGGTYSKAYVTIFAGKEVPAPAVPVPPLRLNSDAALKMVLTWPAHDGTSAGGVAAYEWSSSAPTQNRAVIHHWQPASEALGQGTYFHVGQTGIYEEFETRARQMCNGLPPLGATGFDREAQLHESMQLAAADRENILAEMSGQGLTATLDAQQELEAIDAFLAAGAKQLGGSRAA